VVSGIHSRYGILYICRKVGKNVEWCGENGTREQWGWTENLKTKEDVKDTNPLAPFLSCHGKNETSNAAAVQLTIAVQTLVVV
jgi:hypothetical protein